MTLSQLVRVRHARRPGPGPVAPRPLPEPKNFKHGDKQMNKPLNPISAAMLALSIAAGSADAATLAPRHVELDRVHASTPVDRFFDLAVGADYPGTTGRPENLAQIKTAVDELSFRYVR